MEYQKITNVLDNASNQPSKFRTKNWVDINDQSRGGCNVNSQIKFKTTMLKSNLCDYSDTNILVKGTRTVADTSAADAAANNSKKVIFKNCASFTNCISEIDNTKVDNAKDIDIVMPMYNLIEYSDSYSKTSGSLWEYCKDISAVNNNGNIVNFNEANATGSFNFKVNIKGQTDDDGEIDNVEIMLPLKYLSKFRKILEMPLTNCEVNLILTWSENCIIVSTNVSNQGDAFTITETKLYVPVITLSTQDSVKSLTQMLESGFEIQI